MISGQFKVYSIQSAVFPLESYAVCCVSEDMNRRLCGESFLIFRKDESVSKIYISKVTISNDESAECPVTLNEDFALAEALGQAKIDYCLLAHEAQKASSSPIPFQAVVTEVDKICLISLWIRKQSEKLQPLQWKTSNKGLSEFIKSLSSLLTIDCSSEVKLN